LSDFKSVNVATRLAPSDARKAHWATVLDEFNSRIGE
jgi:hypothetical protein